MKETFDVEAPLQKHDARSAPNDKRGSAIEGNQRLNPLNHVRTYRQLPITPSSTAARDAAERRWNSELTSNFRDHPSIYSQIVEAIDVKLMNAATDAELRQRGSGLRLLINELRLRSLSTAPRIERDERPPGGHQISGAFGPGPVA